MMLQTTLTGRVLFAGYTIHTVVWLVHQALTQVEALEPVQRAVNDLAPALALQGDVLMATMDKSWPTVMGLAGALGCSFSRCLPQPMLQHCMCL